jgi:hypothetical protein
LIKFAIKNGLNAGKGDCGSSSTTIKMKSCHILGAIIVAGSGVFAAEMVSRIVVPLPKLMKYEEAAGACEAGGMKLVRFADEESMDYIAATLIEKNLDRVWIAGRRTDDRKQLALEVFEGLPITYRIDQIVDQEKMLAVLCEPSAQERNPSEAVLILAEETTDSTSPGSPKSEKRLSPSTINITLVSSQPSSPVAETEHSSELPKIEDLKLSEIVVEADGQNEMENESKDVVICTFDVVESSESAKSGSEKAEEEGDETVEVIDTIKSKSGTSRRRRRRSCESSSRSTSCSRNRRYRRSRCSSTSSSECESSFTCDPFDPSGSSSSSSSSNCRIRRRGRSGRNYSRRQGSRRCERRNRRCDPSQTSSTTSSSSSENCGTGRCGTSRRSNRFHREIRLSQRIR